jgi:hypothetical protein
MTYLNDFGHFAELPVDFLQACMQEEYPHLFDQNGRFNEDALKP